jgi:hypothetical protein
MPRSALRSAPILTLLRPLPLPRSLPAATRNVALATSKQHVRQASLESSPSHPPLPRVASCHRERCWSPRASRVWTSAWTRKRQPLQLQLQLVRVQSPMFPLPCPRSSQQFAALARARCTPITPAPPRSLHAVLMSWHCCCHLSSIPANILSTCSRVTPDEPSSCLFSNLIDAPAPSTPRWHIRTTLSFHFAHARSHTCD